MKRIRLSLQIFIRCHRLVSVLRCLKSSCFSVLCLENDVLSIVRCVYVGEVKCVYVGGSVVEFHQHAHNIPNLLC